jgi:hypothetical protein
MTPQRKAFSILNSRDFEHTPIWRVELPDRALATAVEPIDDIKIYDAYVALTKYHLADGTTANGYCFAYDCSGHVVFDDDGEPIYLADYGNSCSLAEASRFAQRLGKSIEQVFPAWFRVSVTYYGAVQEGPITVQTDRPSPILSAP